jgi:hypothetical protein
MADMREPVSGMRPYAPAARPDFKCIDHVILKSNFMKNGMQINPVMFKMIVLVTCFMLAMIYNKSKAADCGTVYSSAVTSVR